MAKGKCYFKKGLSLLMCLVMICSVLVGIDVQVAAVYENTHINTGNHRIDIIAVAETQLGYREGTNNDTKYGTWYGMKNQPWCAMFVSWCARQAGVPTNILKNSARANASSSCFNIPYKHGSEYTPQKGDLFFTESWSHVGLVHSVDGAYFYTIEGNSNNSGSSEGIGVFKLRRKISDYYFGIPAYSSNKPHVVNSSYSTNFTAYLKNPGSNVTVYSSCGVVASGHYITGSDPVTIKEVYTDGCCKVSYQTDSGTTRTYFAKYSSFQTHTHNYTQRLREPDHPHRISERCSSYSTCGGWRWTNDYAKVKTCKDCWECDWNVESTNVSVVAGSTKSLHLTISGFFPDSMVYSTTYDTSLIDVSRSGENFNIKGKKSGTCQFKITVFSDSTGSYIISSKTIAVTVINNNFTVNYNANGGTGAPSSQTKKYGTDLTLSSVEPVGKAYTVSFDGNGGTVSESSRVYRPTFNGWNTNSDGSGTRYEPGATYEENKNLSLYAQWLYENLYNVPIPEREGYYFIGWYSSLDVDSNGLPIGELYTSSSMIDKSLTLYAMWSKSADILFGDYNLDGEVNFDDILLLNKYRLDKADALYNVEELLFRCDLNRNGVMDEEDFSLVQALRLGNATQEECLNRVILCVINSLPKTTYNYGEPLDTSGVELCFVYDNWEGNVIGTNLVISGYDPYKLGEQTITVSYYQFSDTYTVTVKMPQHTVYFDGNGGDISVTSQTVIEDESYGSLPTPTRSGYTFEGWYTSATGGNKVLSSTICQKSYDHTLYAQWSCNHNYSYKITTSATCYSNGVKTYTCSICGDTYTNSIPTINHTSVVDSAVPATCFDVGLSEGCHCSVCGVIIDEQIEIPKTEHTAIIDDAVAPTNNTTGLTEGSHCNECGAIIKEQAVVPANVIDIVLDSTKVFTDYDGSITCSVDGDIVSYQWYGCNSDNKSDKVIIRKATTSSIEPMEFLASQGAQTKYKYFYCVAKSTDNGSTTTYESPLCINAFALVLPTYYSYIDYDESIIYSDSTYNVNDYSNIIECVSEDELDVNITASYINGEIVSYGTGSQIEVRDIEGNRTTMDIVVYGDTNGDGIVDVLDTAQVANVSNNKATLDGVYSAAADINGDGNIDVNDYSAVVNKAVA